MTDLTDLKTPFGLLDRETRAALKAHGGPYEVYMSHPAIWTECQPSWSEGLAIRVKPATPKPRTIYLVECAPCGPVIIEDAAEAAPLVRSHNNRLVPILFGIAVVAAILLGGGSDSPCNTPDEPTPEDGGC